MKQNKDHNGPDGLATVRMVKIISLCLVALFVITAIPLTVGEADNVSGAYGDDFNDGKLYYSVSSEDPATVKVTGAMSDSGGLDIPSSIIHNSKEYCF
jgi:hypothetical protein